LEVFDNTEQRETFGPKRKEVAEGWIKMDIEKLHDLYSSPNI